MIFCLRVRLSRINRPFAEASVPVQTKARSRVLN